MGEVTRLYSQAEVDGLIEAADLNARSDEMIRFANATAEQGLRTVEDVEAYFMRRVMTIAAEIARAQLRDDGGIREC